MRSGCSDIKFGLNYQLPLGPWISDHLDQFDCLEIMVDHYIHGGDRTRSIFRALADRVPLIGHGIGLSLGTDAPLDERYLSQVAQTLEELGITSYSEHLAWTRTPTLDLGNLLPLPRSEQLLDAVIPKIRFIQSYVPASFALENISYLFEFPNATLTDAELFGRLFRETGVGMLLDLENLFLNATNHRFSADDFIDAIPLGMVCSLHIAGGPVAHRPYLTGPVLIDTHTEGVPAEVFALLGRTLERHDPATIILERDDDAPGQRDRLLTDLQKARDVLMASQLVEQWS